MKAAVLKVYRKDTQEYFTYDADVLLEQDVVQELKMESGTIGRGSMQLEIVSASFIGATTIFDLPFEPVRAVLQLDAANYFEGYVARTGVSCDDALNGVRRWAVRLEDTAIDDFLRSLAIVSLNEGLVEGYAQYRTVESWLYFSDGTAESHFLPFYSFRLLYEGVMEEVNTQSINRTITAPWPIVFGPRVLYETSSGEALYLHNRDAYMATFGQYDFSSSPSENNHALPEWTGLDLVKQMQAFARLRVVATYGPFPSTDIQVDYAPGRWPAGTYVLPALDGRVMDEGYELSVDPAKKEDFALQFQNSVRETAPPSFNAPPEGAVYAAAQQHIDEEGRAANESVLKLGYRVPVCDINGGFSYVDGSYSEQVDYGLPVIRAEQKGDLHLVGLTNQEFSMPWRMVFSRTPDAPAPDQTDMPGETWAYNLYLNHALVGKEMYVATGTFNAEGLDASAFQVGRRASGAELEGRNWMLRSLQINEDAEEIDVEMIRPAESPYRIDSGPVVGGPGPIVE